MDDVRITRDNARGVLRMVEAASRGGDGAVALLVHQGRSTAMLWLTSFYANVLRTGAMIDVNGWDLATVDYLWGLFRSWACSIHQIGCDVEPGVSDDLESWSREHLVARYHARGAPRDARVAEGENDRQPQDPGGSPEDLPSVDSQVVV